MTTSDRVSPAEPPCSPAAGRSRPGQLLAPTIVTDVRRPGSDILVEEIFVPVLSMVTFTDEDEAVRVANDAEFGLIGYAFTRDLGRGQRLIQALQTSMLGLNVGLVSNAAAPFGGVEQSGIRREGGLEGIGEYLATKYTLTPGPVLLTARLPARHEAQ